VLAVSTAKPAATKLVLIGLIKILLGITPSGIVPFSR
jgi:hypothetical protein